MITYERQKDGTLKQVDSPPKRAELVEQRIYDRCIVRVGQLEAEKDTLCTRIDELCAEVERLRVANAAFTGRSIRAGDKMACLEAENAKLRELAHLVAEYVSEDQCEGCVTKRACNAGELDMCWIRKAILEKLRELGVDE